MTSLDRQENKSYFWFASDWVMGLGFIGFIIATGVIASQFFNWLPNWIVNSLPGR